MSQYVLDDRNRGANTDEAGEAQTELLCLLMDGIGKHAVEEDLEELGRFQERITAAAERLRAAPDQSQMRLAVEAVIALMATQNEAVKADHKAHFTELTDALRMMTETIGHVGKSSQAAVHQLAVIGKNLEEVTASTDASRLRMRLGVCLKMIREQSESLQAQTDEHLGKLKAFVASSSAGQQAELLEGALDPVTGLPARAFAENLIDEKFTRKTDWMVGVVSVDRLGSFQSRFGQPAADGVMKTVATQLAQRLPVGTTLCRWSPTSFIAITDVTSSYAETSQQWRKVNGIKVDKQMDDGARTAFISLNASVMLEHVRPISSKRGLIQNMDRYVTQHSGEKTA